jgi:hypothetical protein
MNAIERAAEVLRTAHAANHYRTDTLSPTDAAWALSDAGLLVTDEIQALIDAAVAARGLESLAHAVDIYLAKYTP